MNADDVLRQLPGDPGIAVEISTGSEHWRGGEIVLTMDGSGAVAVRHRRAGEETRYDATLGPAELAELVRRLDELGFAGLPSHERDYEPDEMTVTLALRRGEEIVREARVPEADRHDDGRLAAIMEEYDRLVERVTDGALPYGPAAAPR
jgi:hypothetical protein